MASEEEDYTVYKDKAPTDLQERFPDWLIDKTGYEPASAKTKDAAFRDGVRLATALRMPFQASPENRAATEARRAAKAQAAPTPEPAPAAKPAKAVKSAKAAPAPRGRGRGRAATAATTATPDAPF